MCIEGGTLNMFPGLKIKGKVSASFTTQLPMFMEDMMKDEND